MLNVRVLHCRRYLVNAAEIGCLVAVLAGCGGSTSGTETAESSTADGSKPASSQAEEICGLALPCSSPSIDNPHDLYTAMVVGLSDRATLLVETDDSSGCVTCVAPASFFGVLREDPPGSQGALAHVYLSLADVARARTESGAPPTPDTVWSDLHEQIAADLEAATGSSAPTACGLLTAYCASTPAFVEAFVPYLEQVLFREPLDDDPGFHKEHAVKLALAANPPGGLEVIIRFIKTKARVRARMKAVRDLCAYVPHYPAAREALEWVVASDDDLADRARSCLANPSAQ